MGVAHQRPNNMCTVHLPRLQAPQERSRCHKYLHNRALELYEGGSHAEAVTLLKPAMFFAPDATCLTKTTILMAASSIQYVSVGPVTWNVPFHAITACRAMLYSCIANLMQAG